MSFFFILSAFSYCIVCKISLILMHLLQPQNVVFLDDLNYLFLTMLYVYLIYVFMTLLK